MFNRLKDRAKITDQDPIFKARYIGCTETFTASGRGCTTQLVQRLWDNAEEEHFLKRVKLKFTTFGIHMRNMDKKKVPERLFEIENISFCNVDILVNERIFSWISRETDEGLWECHAVICSSPEKAKSMSLVLTRAFHIAYKEWKASHTREARAIERHKRAQSLQPITLTKKTPKQSKSLQQGSNNDIYPRLNGSAPFENGVNSTNIQEQTSSDSPSKAQLFSENVSNGYSEATEAMGTKQTPPDAKSENSSVTGTNQVDTDKRSLTESKSTNSFMTFEETEIAHVEEQTQTLHF